MAAIVEVSLDPNKLYVWESEAGNGFIIISAQNADEAWARLKVSNPDAYMTLWYENGGDDWFTPEYAAANFKVGVKPTPVEPIEYTVDEFPDTWLINRPSR